MESFLDFEQPIAELESKIEQLRFLDNDSGVDVAGEIQRLQRSSESLTRNIYRKLTPWQTAQVARHPKRPYSLDYVAGMTGEFQELHGDRMYADDYALVGGLARIEGTPVMLIGHQKGRDTTSRVRRNYGMTRPEGYRKAQRLMQLAEKFSLPVVTLIDTPGAYPGIGAEERGQSEAIASSLSCMVGLKTPIISAIIGEGGSGGALAIGVADVVIMMQYSIYSVISPEGCASILWKSADHATEAAQAMGITARRLLKLKLVDEVLDEPVGGAHRDPTAAIASLKKAIGKHLLKLTRLEPAELLERRHQRLLQYGVYREA
ncbi:MAG: acetyl-CoA carboxylase carboxyltransferase subunit alpha [Gammaproteobacteria bacterium]|nr:acetyl-CoA carboxylase carboxyltransferase subunit alpha [Gammaproteobacteria bacterium]